MVGRVRRVGVASSSNFELKALLQLRLDDLFPTKRRPQRQIFSVVAVHLGMLEEAAVLFWCQRASASLEKWTRLCAKSPSSLSCAEFERMRGCERATKSQMSRIGVECWVGAAMVRREHIVEVSVEQVEHRQCRRSKLQISERQSHHVKALIKLHLQVCSYLQSENNFYRTISTVRSMRSHLRIQGTAGTRTPITN